MTDPTVSEPGRELDALVAEKVMGSCVHDWKEDTETESWDRVYQCSRCGRRAHFHYLDHLSGGPVDVEPYSTSIADAWKVVEKMADTPGPNGDHYTLSLWYSGVEAVAVFAEMEGWGGRATAETAALAICLAALAALEALAPTDKEAP